MAKIIFEDKSEMEYLNSSFDRVNNWITFTFQDIDLQQLREAFKTDAEQLGEMELFNDFDELISTYVGYTQVVKFALEINDLNMEVVTVTLTQCDQLKLIELLNSKIGLQQKELAQYGTVNTDDMNLDELKAYVIGQSKTDLAKFLEENPITSSAHGGVQGVYSITSEKQNYMLQNYLIYAEEIVFNPDAKLTWNEVGKVCEEWELNEYKQLMLEIRQVVTPLVATQQKFEAHVQECATKDEVLTLDFVAEIKTVYDALRGGEA